MNNENLEVYPLFAKTIVRTQIDLEGTDLSKIEWAQNYQNEISTSQNVLDEPNFTNLLPSLIYEVYCVLFSFIFFFRFVT